MKEKLLDLMMNSDEGEAPPENAPDTYSPQPETTWDNDDDIPVI